MPTKKQVLFASIALYLIVFFFFNSLWLYASICIVSIIGVYAYDTFKPKKSCNKRGK